jgi:NhaP-type Na+/H+ or K+/H+ antiporter
MRHAFVPGVPAVALEPELALALFVAPVLLDAAFDASPRDLRDNWARSPSPRSRRGTGGR